MLTKSFIKNVSDYLKLDEKNLTINSISDKLAYKVLTEDDPKEILKLTEEKVKYFKKINHK